MYKLALLFLSDSTLSDNTVIEGNARIDKSILKENVEILWGGIVENQLWVYDASSVVK